MTLTEKNTMDDHEDEIIPAKKKGDNSKRMSVERIYQKKTQLEHILLRPDSYIGSVEPAQEKMWIFDEENDAIINKSIRFTPGLYKIFDEIIVNAADNKQRDPRMNTIKVNIDVEKNVISIWNNGKGIPVEMHKTEKMYVPTLIFGHLLTSSNYDDSEKKVVGGRNGFGAKLCNIFSTKFTVETASNGKKFKQTWKNNMGKAETEKVTDFSGTDFTCITFSPDLPKFKMEKLDDDFVALLKRRAYDIAGVARGVNVVLNGDKLKLKTFKDYVQFYLKGAALSKKKEGAETEQPKIVHEIVNPRWEVCITVSETGFQQSSFVNSIATTKGGTHVNYLVDQICEKLIGAVKKKTGKGGFNIKPFQVKSHLWVFVNTLIENPTFDSQTKENMTLRKSAFGSTCELSDKYIKQVQDCGVLDNIMSWVRFKTEAQLNKKTFSQKHSKLKGIPKLDDANDAGTKNSRNCTLIITEGDSAKALAMAGLSVIGRDKYGVFPLRGKMLNVRDATHKQIMDNAEVGYLLKIIGLQFGKKYSEDDLKTLRYGHLMIMADQDTDGSHIKGLVINFIHANWPSLLQLNFLEEFITPIVKVSKGNEVFSFFSLPEFEEWKESTPNNKSWRVKYYKGLGTSTGKEGKEYFSDMEKHRITFDYDGPSSDQALVMAFSKKCINERKNWLTTGMEERRLRKEAGLPVVYLYEKDTKSVSYRDFVNKELILFSNADNERSIPCLVDGLKPGQRKVLFTCMKRNDKSEVKVAQLAGSVAEMSAYHHGEASLMGTIVNLAQDFVGSNNLNLLVPHGQFGTRTLGGKDSASPRYIFTKMSVLTRLIFPVPDDNVLSFLFEDNLKIEPEWYCPIIPMVLVNGADGIGTGWATKIPNYDVRDLITVLKAFIAGEESPIELKPSYKDFKGDIEKVDLHRYTSYGVISVIDETTIEISELPIKVWTQTYKENVMDVLLYGNEKTKPMISDYKEYHTDVSVRFIVTMTPEQLKKAESEGLHKVFKLDSSFSTSSMVLFDEFGCIRKFETVYEIIEIFQKVRLQKYQERRVFLLGMLESECSKLENQARFILEKIEGKIIIENKTRRDIITNLVERGFQSDPVKDWKASIEAEDEDDDDRRTNAPSSISSGSGGPDFQYLLTMPLMSLSREKKEELLQLRDEKKDELESLRRKSPQDLWLDELDILIEELDRVEEQERLDNQSSAAIKKVGQNRSAKGRVARPKIDLAEAEFTGGREVKPVRPPKVTKELKKPKSKRESTEKNDIDTEEKSNHGEALSSADRSKKNKSVGKKQTKKKSNSFSDSDDSDNEYQPDIPIAPSSRSVRQKEPKKYVADSDSDLSESEKKDKSDNDSDSNDSIFGAAIKSKTVKPSKPSKEITNGITEEAKTRALIETLSPMKKKDDKPSTKRVHKPGKNEDEKEPPKKKNTTTKSAVKKTTSKPITFDDSSDDDKVVVPLPTSDKSDQDEPSTKKSAKKTAPKRPAPKKTTIKPVSFDDSSNDEIDKSSDDELTKKTPTKKVAPKKKTEEKKVPAKKKAPPKKSSAKAKKRKNYDGSDSDDSGSDFNAEAEIAPVPMRERAGRAAASTKAKYKFSSSEEDGDSDFC